MNSQKKSLKKHFCNDNFESKRQQVFLGIKAEDTEKHYVHFL